MPASHRASLLSLYSEGQQHDVCCRAHLAAGLCFQVPHVHTIIQTIWSFWRRLAPSNLTGIVLALVLIILCTCSPERQVAYDPAPASPASCSHVRRCIWCAGKYDVWLLLYQTGWKQVMMERTTSVHILPSSVSTTGAASGRTRAASVHMRTVGPSICTSDSHTHVECKLKGSLPSVMTIASDSLAPHVRDRVAGIAAKQVHDRQDFHFAQRQRLLLAVRPEGVQQSRPVGKAWCKRQ